MAFTCGFFDSVNGDRRYNSRQLSQIFDGIIVDGVFAHYGTHFAITPVSGMEINVGEGRFWFNHVWGLNDGNTVVTIDPADVSGTRKDAIIIEIDSSDEVRNAFIKVLTGTYSGTNPTLTNSGNLHQYPLAYVTIPAASTEITASNIQVVVGTSECPFATGVLENVSIDNLFNQWDAQFQEWFSGIQSQLEGDVVTNLVNQINQVAQQVDTKIGIDDAASILFENKKYKPVINSTIYPFFQVKPNATNIGSNIIYGKNYIVSWNNLSGNLYVYFYNYTNLSLSKTITISNTNTSTFANINAMYYYNEYYWVKGFYNSGSNGYYSYPIFIDTVNGNAVEIKSGNLGNTSQYYTSLLPVGYDDTFAYFKAENDNNLYMVTISAPNSYSYIDCGDSGLYPVGYGYLARCQVTMSANTNWANARVVVKKFDYTTKSITDIADSSGGFNATSSNSSYSRSGNCMPYIVYTSEDAIICAFTIGNIISGEYDNITQILIRPKSNTITYIASATPRNSFLTNHIYMKYLGTLQDESHLMADTYGSGFASVSVIKINSTGTPSVIRTMTLSSSVFRITDFNAYGFFRVNANMQEILSKTFMTKKYYFNPNGLRYYPLYNIIVGRILCNKDATKILVYNPITSNYTVSEQSIMVSLTVDSGNTFCKCLPYNGCIITGSNGYPESTMVSQKILDNDFKDIIIPEYWE